jgi:hypothetical protein
MARRLVRMHSFVWVIGLCASLVLGALVLGHAHFPKNARPALVSAPEEILPPVW